MSLFNRQLLTLLLLVSGAMPMWTEAAVLTADVTSLRAQAEDEQRIPVIVRFERGHPISELRSLAQADEAYRSEPASPDMRKKRFRREVFRTLKEEARTSTRQIAGLLRSHGVKTPLKTFWSINAVAFDAPAGLLEKISRLPGVSRISADMRLTMETPDTEESDAVPLWNIDRLNLDPLWQQGIDGEGVVVAIMDSGVDGNHPDLAERWRGGDYSWFDPYLQHEYPTDLAGHGTQALGLILGGDESGYAIGAAPGAQWIAARIFDDGNQSTLSAIHAAFQWLLDPDGDPLTDDAPDLVNNSWGFANTIDQCYQEFEEDIRLLREADIGVVFSAGNYGPYSATSISPANNVGAVSVGSIDPNDNIELLSSRGPGACDGGVFPKLVAPGAQVYTTDRLPIGYNVVSGTSFSAPHVTGAMALLRGAFPEVPVSQIETALYDAADDLGEPGSDDLFGYGVVNVAAAYDLLLERQGSAAGGELGFSELHYSVDESTQRLIVSVRRQGDTDGEVSIGYRTENGSAQAGRDYAPVFGRLQFDAGETLRSFEIPIIDDNLDESNETLFISLEGVEGPAVLGASDQAEVTILDDDGAGSIGFDSITQAVNESRGEVLLTLVRSGGSQGSVSVWLNLVDGSALAGTDYLHRSDEIRFLDGETTRQVSIGLVDDRVYEGNEQFQAVIGNPSGGVSIGDPASITLTILDDDPDGSSAALYLEAAQYDVSENALQVVLDVIRSGQTDNRISVEYTTQDGSARQDIDYSPATGTLVFPAGITRQRITLEILNDTRYEQESSFSVSLSNPSAGARIYAPSAAIVRIADDDALPFVSPYSAPSGGASGAAPGRNSMSNSRRDSGGIGGSGSRASNGTPGGLQRFDLNLSHYQQPGTGETDASASNPERDAELAKTEKSQTGDRQQGLCGDADSTTAQGSAGSCVSDEDEIKADVSQAPETTPAEPAAPVPASQNPPAEATE
ncbi:MAG: Calx-beta domain-containing protein [Candidatus Thiodiazotropha sp.]